MHIYIYAYLGDEYIYIYIPGVPAGLLFFLLVLVLVFAPLISGQVSCSEGRLFVQGTWLLSSSMSDSRYKFDPFANTKLIRSKAKAISLLLCC